MENLERKKVFTYSAANGCLTNLMETTSIRKSLQPDGFEACQSADEADVIIVNTCGYSTEAENSSIDVINKFQMQFPQKKVVVSGCLPRINKNRIKENFSGPIISTGELDQLNTLFPIAMVNLPKLNEEASAIHDLDLKTRQVSNRLAEKAAPYLLALHRHTGFPGKTIVNILESMVFDEKTFALSVSKGCLGKCNYCSIKKAKGRLLSRPLPDLIGKITEALEQGYNRIHLLADDVGCWGQDLGLNSGHLLSAIMRLPFDFKLIVNYFDPTWLVRHYSDLQGPLADSRLICLNVPIQSGNNFILSAMDRDYRIEDVKKCLRDLKRKNPHLALKTHIMVAYPGETHDQFLDSIKSIWDFDLAYPNLYGPRPGTPAEKLPQLNKMTRRFRFQFLNLAIRTLHSWVLIKNLFSTRTAA